MTEGSININGPGTGGLSAVTESIRGAAIAEMSGGIITVDVETSSAIDATVNKSTGSAASATARMTGGLIRTYEHNSHGVVASSNGGVVEGDVRAQVLAEMSGFQTPFHLSVLLMDLKMKWIREYHYYSILSIRMCTLIS